MLLHFQPMGVRTLLAALAVVLALVTEGWAAADDLDELYSATTIITGTFEGEKQRGFAEALERVLVKVSGDTDLAGSPEVVAMAVQAEEFVESYELTDRITGVPVRDEQGTRERPHVLTVHFSQSMIDEALQTLGREPWLDRPALTLAITVDNGTNRYLLAQDAEFGADQRAVLAELGDQYGLELIIPGEKMLATAVDPEARNTPNPGQAVKIREALEAEALLIGLLAWNQKAFRWQSQWQIASRNANARWEADGVSFDTVFRGVIEQTMQELSRTKGQ